MWTANVQAGTLPRFDVGCESPALRQMIIKGDVPSGRCLVPGCGRAYDLKALAHPNRTVIGIDIAPTAVEEARSWLAGQSIPPECKVEVQQANFFDLAPPSDQLFDFVYDYTFFCALDPVLRPLWASKMAALIRAGGRLATLIFPIWDIPPHHLGLNGGNPPFPVSIEAYREVLEPVGFECRTLNMLPDEFCHPGREKYSALGVWDRLASTSPAPSKDTDAP